jgi:hypothetical protein
VLHSKQQNLSLISHNLHDISFHRYVTRSGHFLLFIYECLNKHLPILLLIGLSTHLNLKQNSGVNKRRMPDRLRNQTVKYTNVARKPIYEEITHHDHATAITDPITRTQTHKYHMKVLKNEYRRTLDCEKLGLRVFYKTSKNFEGILT